jgi:hypothetical protein
MYSAVLALHSWNRWITLALGIAAFTSAVLDRSSLTERPKGSRWDTFLMASVDLQVLFGLLLYLGLSPLTRAALADFSAAMRVPSLRFWALDHVALMFGSVLLVRLGRVLAMTARTASARRNRRLICFGLALVIMLAAIPWPGMALARPLFRMWPYVW